MRVLVFSAYYTPEVAASMYLTEDLFKRIVEAGHSIELYVPMPTRGVSEKVRKEYKGKRHEKKYNGKLTIHRIAMYREGKSSILRTLRYMLLNVVFFWKGLKEQADVIFVYSTPPTQGMMAGIVGALKHTPVVYNLQDIFPDSLVNSGMTTKGSLIWKIGRKVEDFSYKHAKKIIVISEDFKKNILAKGVPEEKIVVVPNWADVSGVYPVERKDNILIDRYGIDPDMFYITYCGNVGFTQNMDLLLEAAKDLKDELSNLRIVIIGDGADKERVQKRVEEEKIDNVIMLPFQPYEDIAHVFSLGDVGLIISKPGVGGSSVPSKTYSIMAAERPILASFDMESELAHLIMKTDSGVVCDSDDALQFLESVKKMYLNKDEIRTMGKNGHNYLDKYMSVEKCTQDYIDIMSSFL